MTGDGGRPSAGQVSPRGGIEVRVAELRQLFNAIDPSPFRERDLDPAAEAFIVDWSKELPADVPLTLVVHLDRSAGMADEGATLRDAITSTSGTARPRHAGGFVNCSGEGGSAW